MSTSSGSGKSSSADERSGSDGSGSESEAEGHQDAEAAQASDGDIALLIAGIQVRIREGQKVVLTNRHGELFIDSKSAGKPRTPVPDAVPRTFISSFNVVRVSEGNPDNIPNAFPGVGLRLGSE